jgi:hypothetical protein
MSSYPPGPPNDHGRPVYARNVYLHDQDEGEESGYQELYQLLGLGDAVDGLSDFTDETVPPLTARQAGAQEPAETDVNFDPVPAALNINKDSAADVQNADINTIHPAPDSITGDGVTSGTIGGPPSGEAAFSFHHDPQIARVYDQDTSPEIDSTQRPIPDAETIDVNGSTTAEPQSARIGAVNLSANAVIFENLGRLHRQVEDMAELLESLVVRVTDNIDSQGFLFKKQELQRRTNQPQRNLSHSLLDLQLRDARRIARLERLVLYEGNIAIEAPPARTAFQRYADRHGINANTTPRLRSPLFGPRPVSHITQPPIAGRDIFQAHDNADSKLHPILRDAMNANPPAVGPLTPTHPRPAILEHAVGLSMLRTNPGAAGAQNKQTSATVLCSKSKPLSYYAGLSASTTITDALPRHAYGPENPPPPRHRRGLPWDDEEEIWDAVEELKPQFENENAKKGGPSTGAVTSTTALRRKYGGYAAAGTSSRTEPLRFTPYPAPPPPPPPPGMNAEKGVRFAGSESGGTGGNGYVGKGEAKATENAWRV